MIVGAPVHFPDGFLAVPWPNELAFPVCPDTRKIRLNACVDQYLNNVTYGAVNLASVLSLVPRFLNVLVDDLGLVV